jgi:hypothetical protein
MEKQFYIHLPSDSSLDVYPDNTIAKFSTKLARSVDLDGAYDVGLSEIIYPADYYNVDNRELDYSFGIKQRNFDTDGKIVQEIDRFKIQIKSDLYYTRQEFLEKINTEINTNLIRLHIPVEIVMKIDVSDRVVITITRSGPQVTVDIQEEGLILKMFFELSSQFSKRLGFDKSVSISVDDSTPHRAKNKFDLFMGKKLMYVYSDVVTYSLVGDVSVPLLRVCSLPEPSTNNTIHLSFPDIHYKPVQKSHFDTIDISINTEEGMLMPFQSGKVLITLHFRRST